MTLPHQCRRVVVVILQPRATTPEGTTHGLRNLGRRKIRVVLDIDLNADDWIQYQGLNDRTIATMKEDVRTYVLNAIQQANAMEEADATVALAR